MMEYTIITPGNVVLMVLIFTCSMALGGFALYKALQSWILDKNRAYDFGCVLYVSEGDAIAYSTGEVCKGAKKPKYTRAYAGPCCSVILHPEPKIVDGVAVSATIVLPEHERSDFA